MMMLLVFLLGIFDASAVKMAMDPQNRVLFGASYNDGGQGFSVGIESRLTQLIYVNMGGFSSIKPNSGDINSDQAGDWITMNHGIWAAPGWRIPHRYAENSLNWDVIVRGGFACVFSKDANRDDLPLFDPAGLLGADFYLRKNNFGIRWSNKIFLYESATVKTYEAVPMQRPQSALELFYQWE